MQILSQTCGFSIDNGYYLWLQLVKFARLKMFKTRSSGIIIHKNRSFQHKQEGFFILPFLTIYSIIKIAAL